MSLYHEAAKVLDTADRKGGSIKSIIFGRKDWKSNQKALYALTTEATRWSEVLCGVIENSGILQIEKQLTPSLTLLLTHDTLLSKKGVSLPNKHGLYVAIHHHKARLSAELSKARLRRGCATLDALKSQLTTSDGAPDTLQNESGSSHTHPRWIRINTLLTSLQDQITSTLKDFERKQVLKDVTQDQPHAKVFCVDEHIPDLVAIPPGVNILTSRAYKHGELILQDKASCFPACLLDPASSTGDVIDACAAPGNKTTHLAALLCSVNVTQGASKDRRRIFACERDASRSETLSKMVKLAGANDSVKIKARQDFLRLDPHSAELKNVSAILLDPSCSGSGIVGRDESSEKIHLPRVNNTGGSAPTSKKRKRTNDETQGTQIRAEAGVEEVPASERGNDHVDLQTRLTALSSFQLRLLQHAMSFPSTTRITYSTCSLHREENEHVVVKGLLSDIAVKQKWRILQREEQVQGLQKWHRRGHLEAVSEILRRQSSPMDTEMIADACIRCEKGGEDGTMGFFVAAFVRDCAEVIDGHHASRGSQHGHEYEDEWAGFSDEDQ